MILAIIIMYLSVVMYTNIINNLLLLVIAFWSVSLLSYRFVPLPLTLPFWVAVCGRGLMCKWNACSQGHSNESFLVRTKKLRIIIMIIQCWYRSYGTDIILNYKWYYTYVATYHRKHIIHSNRNKRGNKLFTIQIALCAQRPMEQLHIPLGLHPWPHFMMKFIAMRSCIGIVQLPKPLNVSSIGAGKRTTCYISQSTICASISVYSKKPAN